MSDIPEELRKSIQSKIETFLSTRDSTKAVVVCVNCGSTITDQNGLSEIACYTCGNTTYWNAYRFSIIREGDPQVSRGDFINALQTIVSSQEYDNWRTEIDTAIQKLVSAYVHASNSGRRGIALEAGEEATKQRRRHEEDLENLRTTWNECKSKLDELINNAP